MSLILMKFLLTLHLLFYRRMFRCLSVSTKERQRQLPLVRSFHLKTDVNLLAFCLLGFHLFLLFCMETSVFLFALNTVLLCSQWQTNLQLQSLSKDRMAKYYLIKMMHFNKLNSVLDVSVLKCDFFPCECVKHVSYGIPVNKFL